jgi:hypothetical protein
VGQAVTKVTAESMSTSEDPQRSWKNAQDEWASKAEKHRGVAWKRLGEREYGKGKRATTEKQTERSIFLTVAKGM